MTLSSYERKHFYIETMSYVPCAVTNDGAIVMFDLCDVEAALNHHYPRGKRVWYFNETRDREIAEIRGDRVYANPQVLWRHYLI